MKRLKNFEKRKKFINWSFADCGKTYVAVGRHLLQLDKNDVKSSLMCWTSFVPREGGSG